MHGRRLAHRVAHGVAQFLVRAIETGGEDDEVSHEPGDQMLGKALGGERVRVAFDRLHEADDGDSQALLIGKLDLLLVLLPVSRIDPGQPFAQEWRVASPVIGPGSVARTEDLHTVNFLATRSWT
jgi:hypothetical protein